MKKKVTFITGIILATAMLMTGCSTATDTTQTTETTDTASADGDVIKVGVIQMVENGAFNDMREGFIDRLREQGYTEDKCEITYETAQGDATNLNTICQSMVSNCMDLVCTVATPATQAMVNLESGIPVVFVAVSDPVGAGVITDMAVPDKNATGTSNAIPVEDIFALSDDLTPGRKNYGILYNTSEINSVNTVKDAKEYLDSQGIGYTEAVVTNSSEVQQAAQSLVGKVDAIFIPNDSVIQDAMPMVTEIARANGIPVYGSSAVMVDSGAFATIAISDREIGAISADKAIEILEGTPITDVPAEVVPATNTVVNKTTADAIGVTFDEEKSASLQFVEDAQ